MTAAVPPPAGADQPAAASAEVGPQEPEAKRVRRWARAEVAPALEILALCGLAIAQPLLDVTGRSPDFFLFYGAGRGEILLLVAMVTVLPPLALWGIGALSGLVGPKRFRPAVRRAVHAVTLAVLVVAVAVQVGKHLLPLRGTSLALVALVFAAGVTYAYLRWRVPGQLLRVASVGPLVFVALFAFASPVSAVVLPSGGAGTHGVARAAAQHPPVVVLMLDEFPLVSLLGPDGRIDRQRYPNIAALADGSTWYRNATGVSGWTPYAMPAMLTGRYPAENVAPHYAAYPDNLFTLLGGVYDLRVQESITELCPPAECGGQRRPGGLPVLLREIGSLFKQIASPRDEPARDPEASYREATLAEARSGVAPDDPKFRWDTLDDNQPSRFTSFLDGLKPGPRPTLNFLHLLMPHTPWNYLPSGTRYDAPEDFPLDGPGWVETARARHLAQVGYTDKLIGRMIERMRETGLYDRATVIVTADHGVSFTNGSQGRGMAAVDASPEEVLWVPLFVKEPGQGTGPGQTPGRVDDRNWQQVDLLPTIADLAGLSVPWPVEGISAASGVRDGTDHQYADVPGKQVSIAGDAFERIVAGRAGPHMAPPLRPDLVGKDVADLPVSAAPGPPASMLNADAFASVDPAGGTVPALVYGRLPDQVKDGTPLAVVLNGRVAVVTQATWADKQDRRYSAFISDESLFREGPNNIELYEIVGAEMRRLPLS